MRMKRRGTKRHVPQRTCVACRRVRPKWELIRLVRLAADDAEIDLGGRKAGRGAYLCRRRRCWEDGLGGGNVEYALRITLTRDRRDHLLESAEKWWL
jgi:predicted RNA-binding protein YlxR (DUF448 family)